MSTVALGGVVKVSHPEQHGATLDGGCCEERRGSCTSLTLDLTPAPSPTLSQSSYHLESPSRERATEEYLKSVSNRLSKKRLKKCLVNLELIRSEFWDIPMNHPSKCDVPGVSIKNRYRTILPNEKTRVILPHDSSTPLSSYINANYIRGYKGRAKSYIATQGPMSHTVDDFWAMVWHEGTTAVVMITKLKENNKVKCELYLPLHSDEHTLFGELRVTCGEVESRAGYTVRRLTVCHLTTGVCRDVVHHWYTAWPDHKAPHAPHQLLDLARQVDGRHRQPDKGPIVVHCSAGIGRTGCFIATSIGMKQLERENKVDILGIVCDLRQDRGGMVQTNEQYEFVYRALALYAESLGGGDGSGGDGSDGSGGGGDDVDVVEVDSGGVLDDTEDERSLCEEGNGDPFPEVVSNGDDQLGVQNRERPIITLTTHDDGRGT